MSSGAIGRQNRKEMAVSKGFAQPESIIYHSLWNSLGTEKQVEIPDGYKETVNKVTAGTPRSAHSTDIHSPDTLQAGWTAEMKKEEGGLDWVLTKLANPITSFCIPLLHPTCYHSKEKGKVYKV